MLIVVILIGVQSIVAQQKGNDVINTIDSVSVLKSEQVSFDSVRKTSNESDCSTENYNQYQDHNCSSNLADSCPAWFVCNDTERGRCMCGAQKIGVRCEQQTLVSGILNCYCITRVQNETYLGLCFYNCERSRSHNRVYQNTVIYHEISDKNISELNDYMCGRFNRKGISCGQCKPGQHPLVLSYNLSCVDCPDANKNWWKFVFYGFVPLTFFYFFVIFFNINVTSSRLHGFVLFAQMVSTPALVRIFLVATEGMPVLLQSVKLIEPLYSMWNLDPFRSLIPDICLNVSTLQSFALDICLALYPMALMLVSYLLIELYDRNVRCIVFVWKPFRFVFRLIRKKWDIRTSVIDSFATFFLLSYVKIISVAIDLMLFTSVYELNSNRTYYRLFYDSSIKFLRSDHIPLATLSIVLFVVFCAIPIFVLILYPFRCFQKCLSCFNIQWHFLDALVDSFQGRYKDGTEPSTHDLRWFSSYGLVLRLCIGATYFLTFSSIFFVYASLVTLVFLTLLINLEPYKASVSHYTAIDASFLILLSLLYTTISGNNLPTVNGQKFLYLFYGFTVISCAIPIIYFNSIVLHWLYSRRKWGILCVTRLGALLGVKEK